MSIQTLLRCNVEDEHAEKVHTFGRNMTLVHVSFSIIFLVAFVEVVFPRPERDRSFTTEAQRNREDNGIPENSVYHRGDWQIQEFSLFFNSVPLSPCGY